MTNRKDTRVHKDDDFDTRVAKAKIREQEWLDSMTVPDGEKAPYVVMFNAFDPLSRSIGPGYRTIAIGVDKRYLEHNETREAVIEKLEYHYEVSLFGAKEIAPKPQGKKPEWIIMDLENRGQDYEKLEPQFVKMGQFIIREYLLERRDVGKMIWADVEYNIRVNFEVEANRTSMAAGGPKIYE